MKEKELILKPKGIFLDSCEIESSEGQFTLKQKSLVLSRREFILYSGRNKTECRIWQDQSLTNPTYEFTEGEYVLGSVREENESGYSCTFDSADFKVSIPWRFSEAKIESELGQATIRRVKQSWQVRTSFEHKLETTIALLAFLHISYNMKGDKS